MAKNESGTIAKEYAMELFDFITAFIGAIIVGAVSIFIWLCILCYDAIKNLLISIKTKA